MKKKLGIFNLFTVIIMLFNILSATIVNVDSVKAAEVAVADEKPIIDLYNDYVSKTGSLYISNSQYKQIRDLARKEGYSVNAYSDNSRVGAGKSARVIAKWILRNRQFLTNMVGKVLGRKAAVRFGHALQYITGPLRVIDQTIDGGLYQIEQIIINGLVASGLDNWSARTLAAGVRGILSVLV
ncbi:MULTISPECIES: hypothetical protein [Streptococcus]|nr:MULTISPECIES: hypothetical protein [Streptococcus]MCL4934099.1 hypothetical protein [Streptococcus suis]MDG4500366.1 hypothetical protein [Streptococcus suis]MDG4509265.1 hypothetical protein [Streptococcus suis]MDG4519686.1 hypothetical protein [Streptococcus suis]